MEIRLGKIIVAEDVPAAPKKACKLTIDFGKFGTRTSVGRFTGHSAEELNGQQVMGLLNFEPRQQRQKLAGNYFNPEFRGTIFPPELLVKSNLSSSIPAGTDRLEIDLLQGRLFERFAQKIFQF